MDERVYWIWLQSALGVGAPQSASFLAHHLSAKTVYEAQTLSAYPDIVRSLHPEQMGALHAKDLDAAMRTLRAALSQEGWILTPADDEYPEMLRGIYAPPLVLYGRGKPLDLNRLPITAVVGTRSVTENGVYVTRRLAAALAGAGVAVISGGAVGIDSVAVSAALDAGGVCICVQACGLDVDYPQATADMRERLLRSGGMLLSEYPPGEKALSFHFRVRNRLISGIAQATVVTQAPLRSGALITAHWAMEQGRDVFAVPGAVGDPGCEGGNALLQEGAQVALSAEDILHSFDGRFGRAIHYERAAQIQRQVDELSERPVNGIPQARSSSKSNKKDLPTKRETKKFVAEPEAKQAVCPADVSDAAKDIFAQLTAPHTSGELSAALNMPLPKVLVALTELELSGAVSCQAGQRYARV